jgi:hypothetical protein
MVGGFIDSLFSRCLIVFVALEDGGAFEASNRTALGLSVSYPDLKSVISKE